MRLRFPSAIEEEEPPIIHDCQSFYCHSFIPFIPSIYFLVSMIGKHARNLCYFGFNPT